MGVTDWDIAAGPRARGEGAPDQHGSECGKDAEPWTVFAGEVRLISAAFARKTDPQISVQTFSGRGLLDPLVAWRPENDYEEI